MIRVSILYPNRGRFDMDYYLEKHMPMSIARLGGEAGYRGVSVERGLSGTGPEPPFVAVCHFLFDSIEDFMAAFQPHAEALRSDIRNYTEIEPVIQFSKIEIAEG